MANTIVNQEKLSILSSWVVLNDRNIENALTISTEGDDKQNFDLEAIVSFDTCIELGSQNSDTPCTFNLKALPKDIVLTKIFVVSEARIVEVYGQCGEYLTTTHAEFIDDWEGMAVYMADIKLPQPTQECSLKFARLKNKGRMWLYGIRLTVDREEQPPLPEKTVNFQNVNKILKESSYQLTDKAERCKKFLQMYYHDPSKAQAIPNPQTLLKMFEAEYLTQCQPIGSHAKNMSKCLADLLAPKGKNEASEDKVKVKSQDFGVLSEEMKHYIDERFTELERSILLRVDEKFNELQKKQNEKLDQILLLVQNLQLNGANKIVCVNRISSVP